MVIENKTKRIVRWLIPYLNITTIIAILLAILYRKANINYPLVFSNGDENGVFYIVKTIKEHGIFLTNPDVGGGSPTSNMYDYMFSEDFTFAIVKLVSFFSNNVYLITNITYFLFYVFAGWTAFYAASKILQNKWTAYLVAILFAFVPFIQMRYAHLWLCAFFMLPLVMLTAIEISRGDIIKQETKALNKLKFWRGIISACLIAGTGLYYAFFACMAYGFAWIIFLINSDDKKIKTVVAPLVYIFACIAGCVINLLPNLLYCLNEGFNSGGQLMIRGRGECEIFGLKIAQMVFPRPEHRISLLSNCTDRYITNFPLINENTTSALGLIGAIGLVLSLFYLLDIKRRKNKEISLLTLCFILFGTIGGVASLVATVIYLPIRCYNRESLVIMFCALTFFGYAIESAYSIICEKKRINIKFLYPIIVIVLICVGVFDQTVTYDSQKSAIAAVDNNKKFVKTIEQITERGDYIFELPVVDWPSGGQYRMFNGYLEAKETKWSYGAAEGRSEQRWQKQLAKENTDMIVNTIKRKGYSGLYFDKIAYEELYGKEKTEKKIAELEDKLGEPNVIGLNNTVYYWKIDDNE